MVRGREMGEGDYCATPIIRTSIKQGKDTKMSHFALMFVYFNPGNIFSSVPSVSGFDRLNSTSTDIDIAVLHNPNYM